MRYKFWLPAILIFLSSAIFGDENGEIRLNPTGDENSPTGYYIPADVEDCLTELDKMLPEEIIEEMAERTEDEMIRYHHGFGTWLRNNWGLWSGSKLSEYFNSLGIYHPDDMSCIILYSYWRRLNGKPIELEVQIQYYIDFWEEQKTTTDM